MRECFEIIHPKKAFVLHICSEDGGIKEGRLYVNLWSEWDDNLSDGIKVPDENPYYEIPTWIINDEGHMSRLQGDLLAARDAMDAMRIVTAYEMAT